MYPITCPGPGPHDPADGVLGESDREGATMLCPPCSALAQADAATQPQLVTVVVDPAAIDAALASAQKASTVAGLRSAVVALAQQLQQG